MAEREADIPHDPHKKKKKSGGFESMGLGYSVFKAIKKKGYQVPTPIQRRCIPLIMDGKDVVAMARTGSGKTAAFLLPMVEKLKVHSAKVGVRGLVLSPTRELAMQTLKFCKEFAKYTDLRIALVLGGDSMDQQFAEMHHNPDIVIATPGRFLHVVVEMELQLSTVEYIVFDEADRLFEMGFEEQLREILARLPLERQTLLFSATLPKLLVDFAQAGLHDPTLIRLDVDTKLSEQLSTQFMFVRRDDKPSALLYLLREHLPRDKLIVIFAATKHHVEYLRLVLEGAGIDCAYSYGSLDPTARKINVAKFRAARCRVFVVTDVAARGIDIPLLDFVINYDFPSKPKLFVHRVGRVARAGRSGTAYSFLSPDELPYLIDLHLFLGRQLKIAGIEGSKFTVDDDGVLGGFPQAIMDQENESTRLLHSQSSDLPPMIKVITNAYGLYDRSRTAPSSQSVARAKTIEEEIGTHPMLAGDIDEREAKREKIVHSISKYRPVATIFEVHGNKSGKLFELMQQKRAHDTGAIIKRRTIMPRLAESALTVRAATQLAASSADDIQATFKSIIAPGRNKLFVGEATERSADQGDEEDAEGQSVFVPYVPSDAATEGALSIGRKSFEQIATSAAMNLEGDDEESMRRKKNEKLWDRKKKKYVGSDDKQRYVRTEFGGRIPMSYKSHRYSDWASKNKVVKPQVGAAEREGGAPTPPARTKRGWKALDLPGGSDGGHGQGNKRFKGAAPKTAKRGGELKNRDQIAKDRRRKEQLQEKNKPRKDRVKKR